MEHTLRSLAKKYGTNKPTLNARLKKLEREHPELILTSIGENHTILLTETGLMLLEEDLTLRPIQPKKKDGTKADRLTVKNTEKREPKGTYISEQQYKYMIELLEEQIKILEKEIERKNQTISELTQLAEKQLETIDKSIKTITESHILLGREQDRPALTEVKQQEAGQPETPPSPSQRPRTFLAKLLDRIL